MTEREEQREALRKKIAALPVKERAKLVGPAIAPLRRAMADHAAGKITAGVMLCVAEGTLSGLDLLRIPGMGIFRKQALKAISAARAEIEAEKLATN